MIMNFHPEDQVIRLCQWLIGPSTFHFHGRSLYVLDHLVLKMIVYFEIHSYKLKESGRSYSKLVDRVEFRWTMPNPKVGGHLETERTLLRQNKNSSSSNSLKITKPSWHFSSLVDATVKYSFPRPRGRYLNTYSIDDQKRFFFEITRCELHKMKREGWTWRIKTSTRVELCTDCPDLRSLWFTQLQYRPLIWFYANSLNSSIE